MKDTAAPNVVRVHCQRKRFSMTPLIPKVKPGYQGLVVGVKWDKNQGYWNKVVFKEFVNDDGTPCDIFPTEVAISLGDETERTLLFNFTVQADTECKFTVEMHQVSPPEAIAIDPGIILKPGP